MFVLAFIFTMISWWLVNLPYAFSIYMFELFTVWIIISCGFCFAQWISVVVPDPMAGVSIICLVDKLLFYSFHWVILYNVYNYVIIASDGFWYLECNVSHLWFLHY